MIGEIGEVIDVIKKNGDVRSLEDADLRKHLIEELADVLMYFNDVLLCCGIGEAELKEAYMTKFEKNMKRWQIPVFYPASPFKAGDGLCSVLIRLAVRALSRSVK